ncbi:hypothetical protein [Actinomadura alba]|uniref:PH domain-containing protein n=1 Tax=Actinomadura alba TaxID=406431 RepID=A0ABR7LL49_9ACTN|nr:hypothetical protein [Actinomadura alba]MBC6465220.1 hypothetical protein [Actinomadura alba]
MSTPPRPPRATLPVRYNRPFAGLFLALGLINFPLGLLVPGSLINLLLSALFIVLGALLLGRTYFTYTTHTRTLEVIAPIGTRRSFRGAGEDTLIVEGKRIVLVRAGGKRKKLPVSRWMSHAEEWDAVVEAIGQTPKAV